ncbi:TRAP transporter small permease subunit [Acuticoccus sediminis]|uniref:TRAP transporter small permease subunit n=1 Tax=Acuticoccus sediminis TaxID=2184697 RepID=UPI001391EE95|nr:TRAP transporter small permease [Acuticoccus sediminis]
MEVAVEVAALVAGWSLVGLSLLIAVEVVGRKFFAFSLQGADEIGGYVLALSSAIGFSYAFVTKAHIRIDIVHKRLPMTVRAILNVLALALLTAFAAILAWRATAVAMESAALDAHAPTPLATPLVWPQSIWAGALVVFALLAGGATLRAAALLLTGRALEVTRRYDIASTTAEVEDEIDAARQRLAATDPRGTP